MASETRLKRAEIERKFIITAPYGTFGYPSGAGATVVLSTVNIRDTKSSDSSVDSQPKIDKIYRNRNYQHAERRFLNALEEQIKKLLHEDNEVNNNSIVIQATLVQNYSPCNNYKENSSGCADDILAFKKIIEEKGITFSLTTKFANFYLHQVEANKAGLKKLLRNGVDIELIQGEEDWEAFLSDETFVDLTNDEKRYLIDRAKSEKRLEREKEDEDIRKEIKTEADGKP